MAIRIKCLYRRSFVRKWCRKRRVHLKMVSGTPFSEGNIHNYPLQVLLDFGFIGFVVFYCVNLKCYGYFSEGEVLEPLRCIHPLLGSRFIISIQGCGCVTSLFHCGLSSDNDHGAESAFLWQQIFVRIAGTNIGWKCFSKA